MARVDLKLSELSLVDKVEQYHYLDAPVSFVAGVRVWNVVMPWGLVARVTRQIEAMPLMRGELAMYDGTVIAFMYSDGMDYAVEHFIHN